MRIDMSIEPTLDGLDPFARSGFEAPDVLVVSSRTKAELAHNLRYCMAIRGSRVDEVCSQANVSRDDAREMFERGEGTYADASSLFRALQARSVVFPAVCEEGRFA